VLIQFYIVKAKKDKIINKNQVAKGKGGEGKRMVNILI
jgi:hypothetical protein